MALLNTYKLTARSQTFQADRYMHESLLQEGVAGSGDYKVTPGGASLQWSVAAGMAWVRGDDTARQGLYPQVNDAAVTGLVAAGHATLPRIDQVILQIADSSVSGVSDTPTLSTLAGTATAGATLDNRTGAAALPNSAVRVADILVPATTSGVLSAGNIRDRRPWARGALNRLLRTAGDVTAPVVAFGSATAIGSDLQPRVECSGVPLEVTIRGHNSHSVALNSISYRIMVDGVGEGSDQGYTYPLPTNGGDFAFSYTTVITPAAGSHIIAPYHYTGNATGTTRASAARPFELFIREMVAQNTNNS